MEMPSGCDTCDRLQTALDDMTERCRTAEHRAWGVAVNAAAKVAENFYTGIIRCRQTGNTEHVRLHVEYQWSQAVANAIRILSQFP